MVSGRGAISPWRSFFGPPLRFAASDLGRAQWRIGPLVGWPCLRGVLDVVKCPTVNEILLSAAQSEQCAPPFIPLTDGARDVRW